MNSSHEDDEFEFERKQEIKDLAEDSEQLWRTVYIITHVLALLILIIMLYEHRSVIC